MITHINYINDNEHETMKKQYDKNEYNNNKMNVNEKCNRKFFIFFSMYHKQNLDAELF